MSVENLLLGQTTGYGIQICHFHEEGIFDSPVAGAGPQNASIVRLYAPFERISIYWSALSKGKPPILPSEKSFLANPNAPLNQNRVFLGGERYGIVTPDIVGHIWVASGVYHYSCPAPEGLSSNFGLANCPWENTPYNTSQDFYIPLENFVVGLLAQPPQNTGLQPFAPVGQLDMAIQN
jgi:hypothetical protein